MKFLLSFFILFFFSYNAHTALSEIQSSKISCQLPKGEVLTIGCTNNCGRFNTWAVRWYARKLGYKVRLVNLRSSKQSIDPAKVDGILIPGGSDIDPNRYKDKVTPELRAHIEKLYDFYEESEIGKIRDEFELGLLNKYFSDFSRRYQPILGICRGMQLLGVSQGIPLYVDIKQELGIKNRRYTLDKIYVQNTDSLIKEVVGRNRFRGVELHHQGLRVDYFKKHKKQWPYLEITSLSNKGLIAESLEFINYPILGVQFHPEYTFGRVRSGVFRWLLKRSCFNKMNKNKLTRK